MSYCLLKNAFPKRSLVEPMENTPPPVPTQVIPPESPDVITTNPEVAAFIPTKDTQVPLSLARPIAITEMGKHIDSVNHVLECISCRDELMSKMSFYDRNRDIVDMFPYVILIVLLILIFKKS